MIACALLFSALALAAEPPAHRFYVSPAEDRELDSRKLAERVVERLRRECDDAGPEGAGEPLAKGARVILMVPREALASIAARGFLNWHQTGSTRGLHRDRFAIEQELAMARLPYDDNGRKLLPKYALLDPAGADMGRYELPSRYGDVAFVLKDEVSARATWTYADSLDYESSTGGFEPLGFANRVLAHTFAYRRKPGDKNRCGNYCEAQVWGELTVRDAEYAMIPAGTPVPAALKAAGLDVYEYSVPKSSSEVVAPGRAAQYTRGKLLVKAGRPYAPRRRDVAFSPPKPTVDERRALDLYARSEAPWTELKPALLAALEEKNPLLATEAVALASEHLDDPDVVAALKDARRLHEDDRELDVEEWIDRLRKERFCDAR